MVKLKDKNVLQGSMIHQSVCHFIEVGGFSCVLLLFITVWCDFILSFYYFLDNCFLFFNVFKSN